jgi:sigma-B regulation protein RsbU (phosphoserine phosphatase)
MVGDVSGHGYRAALIMALAMSASAIHAQGSKDPGEMLSLLYGSLREELSSTEMYISVFFGVIEHGTGKLRFANTGHPHAFILDADGSFQRLAAAAPPLGLSDAVPAAETLSWEKGETLLVLFTDGIVDSRNAAGVRLGEASVLDVVRRNRSKSPAKIVDAVFKHLHDYSGDVKSPDDLTLLVLRT